MNEALRGVPLSIIFVGIDDTDFSEVLRVYGKVAKADSPARLLYLLPFHESDAPLSEGGFSYRQVELLAALPAHIVSHMHSKELKPRSS